MPLIADDASPLDAGLPAASAYARGGPCRADRQQPGDL